MKLLVDGGRGWSLVYILNNVGDRTFPQGNPFLYTLTVLSALKLYVEHTVLHTRMHHVCKIVILEPCSSYLE